MLENGKSAAIFTYNGITPTIHPSVFLCKGVIVLGDVHIGKDSSVWFNSVIRGDVHSIRIGERTNVQDLSMLHVTYKKYPLIIGNDVTIGHSAIVHGATVGDNVLIGMGAKVLDRSIINNNSMVAAGSVVREGFEVPEGVLVAGVPAKIVRDLKPEEIEKITQSAQNYMFYADEYRKNEE